VSSPTGGLHLYFHAPADSRLRNTAGEAGLGWKIDTRAHGGFIIAAGSVRREGLYRAASDAPMAELPHWLAQALATDAPEQAGSRRAGLRPGRTSAYLRAILDGESDAIRGAAVGGRNHALNRAAFNLGRLVGGRELDEDIARRVLFDAAAGHVGIDQFTEAEAWRTIDSGLKAGQARPRHLGA
jgi:hypothetical protein